MASFGFPSVMSVRADVSVAFRSGAGDVAFVVCCCWCAARTAAIDTADNGLWTATPTHSTAAHARSRLINLTLVPRCERGSRAMHATGARQRRGARERVSGSPRGEAPRIRLGRGTRRVPRSNHLLPDEAVIACPEPSLSVCRRSMARSVHASSSPFGHRISTRSTARADPARSAGGDRSASSSCRRRAPPAAASPSPVTSRTQRANGAAIRPRADEFHGNPVVFAALIEPEQIGRVVDVVDHHVDVAIVVEVGERGAACRPWGSSGRSEGFGDVGEAPVARLR